MCNPEHLRPNCTRERWLDVPYLEHYQASCQGRIRNKDTGHIKAQDPSWNGYWRVQIWINREGRKINKKYRVHRLVAAAWLGDDIEHDVDHKDTNKNNNAAFNLRYLAHDENVRAYYERNTVSEQTESPVPT